MATKVKTQARLVRAEAFVLAGVLLKHDTANMRWSEVEALACEALGKKIGEGLSRDSIKGVMEDAKIPLPTKSAKQYRGRATKNSNGDRIAMLSRYVRDLYAKLGEEVPAGIHGLCGRTTVKPDDVNDLAESLPAQEVVEKKEQPDQPPT